MSQQIGKRIGKQMMVTLKMKKEIIKKLCSNDKLKKMNNKNEQLNAGLET